MKFGNNFDSLKNQGKKILRTGLIVGAGLLASNSAEAQSKNNSKDAKNIEISNEHFLNVLHGAGIAKEMTSAELAKLSKPEMDVLSAQYAKATNKLLPNQAPRNSVVIKRISYGIDPETVKSSEVTKEVRFDFDAWFKEQWSLVKEGKIKEGELVLAPNGNVYAIELNNNPVEKKNKKVSKVAGGNRDGGNLEAGNTLADNSNEKHFELLKNFDFSEEGSKGSSEKN